MIGQRVSLHMKIFLMITDQAMLVGHRMQSIVNILMKELWVAR